MAEQRKQRLLELKEYLNLNLISMEDFERSKAAVLQEVLSSDDFKALEDITLAPKVADMSWYSLASFASCNESHVFFPFEQDARAFVVYCQTLRFWGCSRQLLVKIQHGDHPTGDPFFLLRKRCKENINQLMRTKLKHNYKIAHYLQADSKVELYGLDGLNYLFNQGLLDANKISELLGLQCLIMDGITIWEPVNSPVSHKVIIVPRKRWTNTPNPKRAKVETPESEAVVAAIVPEVPDRKSVV